jgi:hypothetical protein
MCQCGRCTTADDGRGFVNERVVGKRFYHEQGVVYAAREVAGENGIAYVLTPYGQPLALTLFQVAAPHDRPAGAAIKHPPAGLDLIVEVNEGNDPRKPAGNLLLSLQGRWVHVLAITRDVPAAGKDEARALRRKV